MYIDKPELMEFGENVFVNHDVHFVHGGKGNSKIIIGNDVNIGPYVKFICVTHEIGDSNCRAGKDKTLPIYVENGCWIGANAVILPGVKIGKGCIIAAGATVANDCKDNCLYGGVPARIIRELE
jgi:maltose O-acetyltransferase